MSATLPSFGLPLRLIARRLSNVSGAGTAGGTRGPGSACVAHTTGAGRLWFDQGADRAGDVAIGHVELGKQMLQFMGIKWGWQIVGSLGS